MPLAKNLIEAAGNASEPNYIESVFSTYLYTGASNTALQIQNGIDLSTKGGMVWIKCRSNAVNHALFDTARGVSSSLQSNSTNAAASTPKLGTFNTDGFTHSATPTNSNLDINETGRTFASWTFREQPKFFNVVTYTGTGSSRTVAHNLGSTPGCIIVKRTSGVENWTVYHQSQGANKVGFLNLTNAFGTNNTIWGNTSPTSTVFTVGDADAGTNANGSTYVAYLFAHNAGGFGLTGTDNVISCGSFTSTGSVLSLNLGWEPQWLLYKESASTGDWKLIDNMRGFQVDRSGSTVQLNPNLSAAESALGLVGPTSTGFTFDNGGSGVAYIYIAIRRGPMKVPTDATKVFAPIAYTGSGSAGKVVSGSSFPPDLSIFQSRAGAGGAVGQFVDRLRGGSVYSAPSSTAAEGNTGGYYIRSFDMDGVTYGTSYIDYNASGTNYINWMMKRAPSFFDEVCATSNGSAVLTSNHNLGVTPELIITKRRSGVSDWPVYCGALSSPTDKYLNLNQTIAATTYVGGYSVSSTSFTVNGLSASSTYVAYLFATCAGVQYINSYVGDGTTGRTINCGFTGGARFVCIKATSTTGSWWTFDSARGIVTNSDPALQLNSTAAEVTSADAIDTAASGFIVNQEATCSLNASGVTYLVWAIA